ncbi:hypothetical protein E2562_018634 [Oryza meyeriana var. granulata]|uniref:Uncharacterized protein n=1 Tax=Oryza meyeriana var. granulata TaxID=110450 RepID=A0A6G1BZM2_9ORYZ|nr:hypothetical protein E2562_018634 [Oryza meyeriana var. granulata]
MAPPRLGELPQVITGFVLCYPSRWSRRWSSEKPTSTERTKSRLQLSLAEAGHLCQTNAAQLEELATVGAACTELQRTASFSINMRCYHCLARAALEPFGVELNDPREETPKQYVVAFGRVTEALEKMPVSLEEKSRA